MFNMSQSQLQSIIKRNQLVIRELERVRTAVKQECKFAYAESTPETEDGQEAFTTLNIMRDRLRTVNAGVNHFAKIQKVLKSLMRDMVTTNRELNFHRKQK